MLCETGTIKCEEKKKESPNLTKELSYVILKPHIVRMELSNVRKKKVREPPNVKKTVTCDVETAQCEDETIKCEKKMSHVMLEPHNVRMEQSSVRKKK